MSNIIVMVLSPGNIVGCLLKKGLQGGGGHGHPRTPPRYALVWSPRHFLAWKESLALFFS